jgi:hypothetical protein
MRGLVVIAFVLTIFGVACTPHTTSNTDASFDSGPSVSDMGTTTTGLPDQGSSMDGGNPTYANKATLEIAGAGTGSVAIGSAKYSCPQFQPCQWAELNVTGSVLVAAADTGSEFLGWVGPCDPQMIAKNKTQCKVLASATATISKVTAVFSPVCSADGWCSTRLPIPAGRTVLSIETRNEYTDLLINDGYLYRISQKPGGVSSALQPFDPLTTRTMALATCSTPDGTLYFSTNSGLIASYKSKLDDPTNLSSASLQNLWVVGTTSEQIHSLTCGNNNSVWATSLAGMLYVFVPGTSPGWRAIPIASRLPIPTDSTLSGSYVIGDNDALFVGSAGLVVRSKNDILNQIAVPSDVTTNLYAVSGSGEKAWIAGANGTALYWDGVSIKRATLPPPPMGVSGDLLLTITSFMNGSEVQAYVAGLNGKIYHCNGTSCTAEASGVRSPTLRTSFTTPTMHVVCGSESTCLTKQR